MRLSIIIPTYCEAGNIGALLHYLKQNSPQSEIIVVDANSPDNTAAVANAAGARVINSPISGRARQMNLGAANASHEVLYFVHADTLPPQGFEQAIANALKRGVQMGCFRYRFQSDSWILRINSWFTRFYFMWCQGGDKTFFISKSDFQALGAYDERYVVMEEYDFLRRALPLLKFEILPENALVSARKYRNNSWLRVQLANALAFYMFNRNKHPEKIKAAYKKMLRP
jgi:rSAM/selenodomain-associated transferase 2